MSDTIQGALLLALFLLLIFAASRVLARITGAKYRRALLPLAPLIDGSFATDSLSHGWLAGTVDEREVRVAAIPGVAIFSEGTNADRYNAFDVELHDVAGARDWSLSYGMHNVSQILSRGESWRWTADSELKARLEDSSIVGALDAFAGAGVRGFPTVRYSARQKTLTHRDNVSPAIAPTPQHFQRQLDLLLTMARISEQVNR